MAHEHPEEFAPGLDLELQELAGAFSDFKDKMLNPKSKLASKADSKSADKSSGKKKK